MGNFSTKGGSRLLKNIIWTYWHQGFNNAPFVIQKCVQRVREKHPDYTIHLLDGNSVYNYADEVPISRDKWNRMLVQHRSDLLRTQLLIKYGGIWMDPTVYCMRSFEKWLPEYMDAGVFFFYRPGPDRILANWFIAAEPNSYLLKALYSALVNYWNEHDFINVDKSTVAERCFKRCINGRSLEISQIWLHPVVRKVLKIYPYMIYHFMVYHLIKNDSEFRKIWEKMPRLSADGPHRLKRFGLLKEVDSVGVELVEKTHSPLFKLNWDIDDSLIQANSMLLYLFNHNR